MFPPPLALLVLSLFFFAPGADRTRRLGEALDRAWLAARPEWGEMAVAILKGESTRPGKGWWGPGEKARDGGWLMARYDRSKDGRIDRAELPVDDALYDALDHDLDGEISQKDFDGPGAGPPSPSDSWFRRLDEDSNGRVTREELLEFFDRADSLALGFLTPDDLRAALADREDRRALRRDARGGEGRDDDGMPSPWQMLLMLFSGQLGSLREGPRAGDTAPDFRLPVLGRAAEVALSASRGKRPVVLVFGSFT